MNEFYLGIGLKSPLLLVNGKVQMVNQTDLITQSITDILTTEQGSRFMLGYYGSRLHMLYFEPNDIVLKGLLYTLVKEALDMWEKRIEFQSLECVQENDRVDCSITYRVLQSNEVDTFIFPFYRKLNT